MPCYARPSLTRPTLAKGNGKNGRNRGFDFDPTKAKKKKGKRFGAERAEKFLEEKTHKKVPKPNLKRTNRNGKPTANTKRAGVKEEVFGKTSKMVKGFKKGKPKH